MYTDRIVNFSTVNDFIDSFSQKGCISNGEVQVTHHRDVSKNLNLLWTIHLIGKDRHESNRYTHTRIKECTSRPLGSNNKGQLLTAEQRVSTAREMVQSIRSEVSHCPSLLHVLKARLDCDAAHGHDWLAVSPPRVRGQVTMPLGSSSGGQNGPAAE